MKNKIKKIVSVFIVLVMILGTVPANAIADLDFGFLKFFTLKASATSNGLCGENASWSYNSTTNTLTVSGSGAVTGIADFSDKSNVKSIVISDGITEIAPYTFDSFQSLVSVEIAESVDIIGMCAFNNCTRLYEIVVVNDFAAIGEKAFYNTAYYNNTSNWVDGALCIGNYLIAVNTSAADYFCIPDKIKTIAACAIKNPQFEVLYIPESVKKICDNAISISALSSLRKVVTSGDVDSTCDFIDDWENITLVCQPGSKLWKQYGSDPTFTSNGNSLKSVYLEYPKRASVSQGSDHYGLYDTGVDWIEAKYICEALGGHLVTIADKESDYKAATVQANLEWLMSNTEYTVSDASSSNILKYQNTNFWIGAKRSSSNPQKFEWITGETFGYTKWNSGEPNNEGGAENCAEMLPGGKWNDAGYQNSRKRGFICEFNYCNMPSEVFEYNGHTYFIFNESCNWITAENNCRNMCGHLVTITSKEENDAITSHISRQLQGNYYLGLKYEGGSWKWVTGESFSYNNWDNDVNNSKKWPNGKGEPSGNLTEKSYGRIISRYYNGYKEPGEWYNNPSLHQKIDLDYYNYYETGNCGYIMEIDGLVYSPVNAGYNGTHYYEIYENSVGLGVADYFAEKKGGHLVTLTSAEEETYVKSLMQTKPSESVFYWTGSYHKPYTYPISDYIWTTNENWTYTNWGTNSSGRASPGTSRSCNARLYGYGWSDGTGNGDASNKMYFVVEYDIHAENVSFRESDGSLIKTESVIGNSTIPQSVVPTKTGYTAEWYSETELTNEADLNTFRAQGPVDLYAKWIANKYTLYFDANGGETAAGIKKRTVTFDSKYGVLPPPTRTGYDFVGWYTSKTGGSKVTSNVKVTTAEDHSVYAHWSNSKYTVIFDCNGGTVASGSEIMQVTYDETYGTLPTPVKNGYNFAGWVDSQGNSVTGSTVVNIAGDHTLKATWSDRSLISISVKSYPEKKNYVLGESFDPTGLVITATFSNEETVEITPDTDYANGLSYSENIFTTAGSKTITAEYTEGDITKTFNISGIIVSKGNPVSVKLVSTPAKIIYNVGENINTGGLMLKLTYLDNSTEIVTSGFTCTPSQFNRAGKQKVTIDYHGFESYFYVTVNDNVTIKEISSVELNSLPSKTDYFKNDLIDLTGLAVKVTYSDGTADIIDSGFSVTKYVIKDSGEEITSLSEPTTITVTVSFTFNEKEYSESFDVVVFENGLTKAKVYGNNVTVFVDENDSEKEFTVPVFVENIREESLKLMGYSFTVTYNAEKMKYTGIVLPDGFENYVVINSDKPGEIKILFSGVEAIELTDKLFDLCFSLTDVTPGETYTVDIKPNIRNTFEEDMRNIEIYSENMPIEVNVVASEIIVPERFTATFVSNGNIISVQEYNILSDKLVEPDVPSVPYKLNGRWEKYDLSKGGDLTINAVYDSPSTFLPASITVATEKTIKVVSSSNYTVENKEWYSDDPSVATVDSHGNITAVSDGECFIKVICYGKDDLGNVIKSSDTIRISVISHKKPLTFKEWFRQQFDSFFNYTLHDIVNSFVKAFVRYLLPFVN